MGYFRSDTKLELKGCWMVLTFVPSYISFIVRGCIVTERKLRLAC